MAATVGLVLGVALFAITSVPPGWGGIGPCIVILADGGTVEVTDEHFDPWTGQPRPRTYACDPDGPGPAAAEMREVDLLEGSAIPVPVGFALGFGIAWLILAPRRTTSGVAKMGGAAAP